MDQSISLPEKEVDLFFKKTFIKRFPAKPTPVYCVEMGFGLDFKMKLLGYSRQNPKDLIQSFLCQMLI
jgi:hypothetical protein